MFTSHTCASLAACATLAVLALAPAVHAQNLTLNTGDVVTVNGTGTHGTTNNSTSSYTGTNTYRNNYAVQANGTAIFTLGNGGTLTSEVNSNGLVALGSGTITITGGSITTGSGGYGLFTVGTSPATITGGSISAGTNGTGLYAEGSGTITITGGSISAGSGGLALYTQSFGSVDLYGLFDGLTLGQIQTLPVSTSFVSRSFTGTLQNNTMAQTFSYINYGTITLHNTGLAAAPEPSQFAALAIGLLGLGALALRARRRTA